LKFQQPWVTRGCLLQNSTLKPSDERCNRDAPQDGVLTNILTQINRISTFSFRYVLPLNMSGPSQDQFSRPRKQKSAPFDANFYPSVQAGPREVCTT
jgi:hypothetical protein